MEKYSSLLIFLWFDTGIAIELFPADTNYQKLKDGETNNSPCFGSEAISEAINVRSLLECSVKCSQLNPAYNTIEAMNATCNAFNYMVQEDDNTPKCQLHHVEFGSDNFPTFQLKNCRGYFVIVDSISDNITAATVSTITTTTANASVSLIATTSTNDTISTTPSVISATLCPRLDEVYSLISSSQCNFPFTYNGGLFFSCSNKLPGLSNPCEQYLCMNFNNSLAICQKPLEYNATTSTIYLTFPNATLSTSVLSVNRWIVVQQRIDGTQSFNQNWASYKAGFGTYNANFWLGLERIYQLTDSANYRLRFEVLINGYWMSDEYDSFKIDSEELKYVIHVSGYCGNNYDVLNIQIFDGNYVVNGMKFSTPDQDNTPNLSRCAQSYMMGYWINTLCIGSFNGIYDNSFLYYDARSSHWLSATFCRIMIKRV